MFISVIDIDVTSWNTTMKTICRFFPFFFFELPPSRRSSAAAFAEDARLRLCVDSTS